MNLSDQQKFKVRELQRDPVFMSILHQIKQEMTHIPPYRLGGDDDAGAKFDRYVYQSGSTQAVQTVLTILGYDDDREK